MELRCSSSSCCDFAFRHLAIDFRSAKLNVTFRFVLFMSSEFFIFWQSQGSMSNNNWFHDQRARTLCLWINVFDDNRKLLALEMGTHESRPTALCNFMLCSNYRGKIMSLRCISDESRQDLFTSSVRQNVPTNCYNVRFSDAVANFITNFFGISLRRLMHELILYFR